MRFRGISAALMFLAGLMLTAPAWAKTVRATLDTMPATIANTQLKAGEYTFEVKGDQLTVISTDDGKVIAKGQGKWVDSKQKASEDELVLDKDQVSEIHFAHMTQYFVLK